MKRHEELKICLVTKAPEKFSEIVKTRTSRYCSCARQAVAFASWICECYLLCLLSAVRSSRLSLLGFTWQNESDSSGMENEGWKSSEWLQKGIYFLARGLAESSSEQRGARRENEKHRRRRDSPVCFGRLFSPARSSKWLADSLVCLRSQLSFLVLVPTRIRLNT